jgi:hypothetical protein
MNNEFKLFPLDLAIKDLAIKDLAIKDLAIKDFAIKRSFQQTPSQPAGLR